MSGDNWMMDIYISLMWCFPKMCSKNLIGSNETVSTLPVGVKFNFM